MKATMSFETSIINCQWKCCCIPEDEFLAIALWKPQSVHLQWNATLRRVHGSECLPFKQTSSWIEYSSICNAATEATVLPFLKVRRFSYKSCHISTCLFPGRIDHTRGELVGISRELLWIHLHLVGDLSQSKWSMTDWIRVGVWIHGKQN